MNKSNKTGSSIDLVHKELWEYECELMGQSYNEYEQYMQNVLTTLILESDESNE